ncbi:glucosamine inositolphosphorylceramide transferase family protein [Pedobacter gandavensis]|uniref:Glucosamine inositolphosphorylceramide transferase 1 N-terminal domain-containing protein n=1 Tax=Pedobacter gandavensis TaxID=2679963 RepID=A0ABR6EUG9_9SPHI|nr:hypothetical protein [Pedobacter gandavensis]MBB2148469.1 hypothetical protein [Pedobacter gandavensis]
MNNIIDRYFGADKWNIGTLEQSARDLVLRKGFNGKVSWFKEDKADYSADPFVLSIKSNLYIYYEELNFWKIKGKIAQIKNFDFSTKQQVTGILPANIHLSYPYIFEEKGSFYCIPETADAAEVSLYQVNQGQPTVLTKKRNLLGGARFVDSSIVKYQGRYWLFTNIDGELNDLYIYHAEHLGGEFIPHKLNPIPVVIRNCRGAGSLFMVDDVLYRPTQNLELRYGGSIIINKITELTADTFKSEQDFELLPEAPYLQGMHNISFGKDVIVVDGKRRRHSPITPVHRLLKKLLYQRS